MRARTRTIARMVAVAAALGTSWLGLSADAVAASLCPAAVEQPVLVPETRQECSTTCTPVSEGPPVCVTQCRDVPTGRFTDSRSTQTGFVLKNGACTNAGGPTDPSAFSGAALASQALSELSQTTTQETTRNTTNSIADRRRQEVERCAEGFVRVNGACEPVARPAPVTAAVEAAPPAPAVEPRGTKAVPAKPRAVARRKEAPAVVQAVRVAPPPPMPLEVEAPIRFGAWTQAFGDYEKRNASGLGGVLCCTMGGTAPGVQLPLNLEVRSRTGTVGFQAGADFTTRGLLFADDGLIVGAIIGYVTSNVTVNATSLSTDFLLVPNGTSTVNARLSGLTTGLYATYFNNGFSTDFLLKADVLRLDETFTDSLGFSADLVQPNGTTFVAFNAPANVGAGTTSLVNTTLAGNFGYRIDLQPNFWVEPTVGAQYTHSSYGAGAAALGLADGDLVMVQGGARVGTSTWLGDKVAMTTTLAGLAYSDVLVSGGFIPGAAFAASNILARADEGQVRGRGLAALNFDFGQGVKSFIQGDVRGGKGLIGAGGKAGMRLEW